MSTSSQSVEPINPSTLLTPKDFSCSCLLLARPKPDSGPSIKDIVDVPTCGTSAPGWHVFDHTRHSFHCMAFALIVKSLKGEGTPTRNIVTGPNPHELGPGPRVVIETDEKGFANEEMLSALKHISLMESGDAKVLEVWKTSSKWIGFNIWRTRFEVDLSCERDTVTLHSRLRYLNCNARLVRSEVCPVPIRPLSGIKPNPLFGQQSDDAAAQPNARPIDRIASGSADPLQESHANRPAQTRSVASAAYPSLIPTTSVRRFSVDLSGVMDQSVVRVTASTPHTLTALEGYPRVAPATIEVNGVQGVLLFLLVDFAMLVRELRHPDYLDRISHLSAQVKSVRKTLASLWGDDAILKLILADVMYKPDPDVVLKAKIMHHYRVAVHPDHYPTVYGALRDLPAAFEITWAPVPRASAKTEPPSRRGTKRTHSEALTDELTEYGRRSRHDSVPVWKHICRAFPRPVRQRALDFTAGVMSSITMLSFIPETP